MRKERAEAAKQATAKRKATVARKKQEREQNEEEERQLDLSSDDVEAELTAQQKRRHKLKERNFATFSRFILEGFGVDEDRGRDPLRRLREDRKRLQSRQTRDRGDSSDESSEEAKPRRQKRRKSRVLEAGSSGSEDRKSVKRTLKEARFASKRNSGKAKKQEKPLRGETANDLIVIDDSE